MIRGRPFKKGHIGYRAMLGKNHSLETRKKISETMLGERNPNYGKSTWIKGKHHSEEAKRKIGDVWRGKKRPEETRKKKSANQKE